jgi:hypothetical protein
VVEADGDVILVGSPRAHEYLKKSSRNAKMHVQEIRRD